MEKLAAVLQTFWKKFGARACFHGRAPNPLHQLEIKRLSCSPTAPGCTMPEKGENEASSSTWIPGSGAVGKLRSMEAKGPLPGSRGGNDFLGFGLFATLHSRWLQPPTAVQLQGQRWPLARWCTALQTQ
jgi:hypothetical protein